MVQTDFYSFTQFRKRQILSLIVLTVFISCPLSWAKKHMATPPAIDTNYVSALATANRFLSAWQSNDHEAGLMLLTNRAKHQNSETSIEGLFHGTSQKAFEIVHGRKLSPSRYEFPVVLLQSAEEFSQTHRKFTAIAITNTGKNDWAVDTLP